MLIRNTIMFVTLCVGVLGPAQAAIISETGAGLTTVRNCSLRIDGQITAGDAAKTEAILARQRLRRMDRRSNDTTNPDAERINTYVACLSGPGGSFIEGIKLAELFATHGVATVVPDGLTCESACAIAFLGGRACCDEKGKPVVQRFIFPGSRVGFHAPSLNVDGARTYSREAALQAFDLGLEAVARLRKNAERLTINKVFMSKILGHRGGNIYYLESLDDAELNKILLTSYRPLPLRRDSHQAACWNAWHWHVVADNAGQLSPGESPYRTFNSQEWNAAFADRAPIRNNIYEIIPFDGTANCLVREVRKFGRRMIEVVISEGDVFTDPNPHLRGVFRPTLLMRGNRTLDSTR